MSSEYGRSIGYERSAPLDEMAAQTGVITFAPCAVNRLEPGSMNVLRKRW